MSVEDVPKRDIEAITVMMGFDMDVPSMLSKLNHRYMLGLGPLYTERDLYDIIREYDLEALCERESPKIELNGKCVSINVRKDEDGSTSDFSD